MKIVCVSKFNYYDLRIKDVMTFFENKGHVVTYVTGNYDTMTRQPYTLDVPNTLQLPVTPYHKNISFQRIYSHYQFAQSIYRYLKTEKPDVIYAMVPPNFMAYFIAKYKKQYPQTKVIFDVFDMWPETFPSSRLKKVLALPFKLWEKLRTNGFKRADLVLTECDLFTQRLKQLGTHNAYTLYPYKNQNDQPLFYEESSTLGICYLGSINNIIDIDRIEKVLAKVHSFKPVCLHVIGNGEKKVELLQRMRDHGIDVKDYGNVYDDVAKQAIFNQCAFGINVLKESVFIGLTLKSIDYFNGGLPVLNTVPQDTADWIETFDAGINVTTEQAVLERIQSLTADDILNMKQRARQVYTQYLSPERYRITLQQYLERIDYDEDSSRFISGVSS